MEIRITWAGGITLALLLFTTLGVAGPSAAAATEPNGVSPVAPLLLEPVAQGAEGEPVRTLQQLLSVLGYHPTDGVNGVFDAETARSLQAFQRAYGLEPTGQLDAPTRRALGDDQLNLWPRFLYTVRARDRLSAVARRFGSSLPWIARLNPHLKSVHYLKEGEQLLIPVAFPLPEGVSVGRMQVLEDRFLGSYEVPTAYVDVGEILARQLDALRDAGFEADPEETGAEYGITLRGKGVVLGRITFAAAQGGTATQMDIGLLFSEEPSYPREALAGPEHPTQAPSPSPRP